MNTNSRLMQVHASLATLGVALLAANIATAAPKDQLSRKDQNFVTEAIQGDLAEIKMGQLAQQNGQSDQVKQFGKTLEQDHSDHLQKAQQIAQQNRMRVPNEPTAKQQANYKHMSSMSGAKFDSAFAKDMVQDHEKDIGKYNKEALSGSALSDFAKQTLPVLKKHLQMAESIQPQSQAR
jgi:putative membrane protein